jgi:hypothetical protein
MCLPRALESDLIYGILKKTALLAATHSLPEYGHQSRLHAWDDCADLLEGPNRAAAWSI